MKSKKTEFTYRTSVLRDVHTGKPLELPRTKDSVLIRRMARASALRFLSALALTLCLVFSPVNMARSSYYYAAAGSVSPYILNEQFDASGYDNAGWTASGSPNPDDSPLVAGQGWSSTAQASYSTYDFGVGYNSLYAFFIFLRDTSLMMPNVFEFLDSSDAVVGAFQAGNGLGNCSNGTASGTAFGNSGSTVYFIWLEYTKGTGTDGITRVYQSTDGTKTLATQTLVGTATAQAQKIRIRGIDSSTARFDYIYVSTSVMTGVPP